MKCLIISPKASMGPIMKAFSEGHRVENCPVCGTQEAQDG